MTYINQTAFKNPKFLVTTHTTAQVTSSVAGTLETISGSEISYTPYLNSSKVIYEISFCAEKKNSAAFQCLKLEEYNNGSWSEINSKFRRNYGFEGGPTGQVNRWAIFYRFILPAWVGERDLRLRTATSYSGLGEMSLHQLTEWDGSSATDQFCNTNLLVYSI